MILYSSVPSVDHSTRCGLGLVSSAKWKCGTRKSASIGRTGRSSRRPDRPPRYEECCRHLLPDEGAVLRVFFGLGGSGQMKLCRIKGHREIGGKEKTAVQKRSL